MRSMVHPTNGIADSKIRSRRAAGRTGSETKTSSLTSLMRSGDSVSSLSSMESLSSSKTRDKSRSRDILDIPQPQSSYSWRRNFNNLLQEESGSEGGKAVAVTVKDRPSRRLSNIVENFNQQSHQSPSLSIIQIKLAGESRLTGKAQPELASIPEPTRKSAASSKDVEKSTYDVDVQEKREIFEGKQDEDHRPRLRKLKRQESVETKHRSSRENWAQIRDKHCPITAGMVNQDRGSSLRSSILGLGEPKISFKNLKFTKQPAVMEAREESVACSKEFEDTATEILYQMRKQRRTMQMEYVAKVSIPTAPTKKVTTGEILLLPC